MRYNKALGYIRTVSDDRNAVDEQKRNIENAAVYKDCVLKDIYYDIGNGADMERDGLKRLLDEIDEANIDTVFVQSAEILSTDHSNTEKIVETLSHHNTHIYSLNERKFL